jgi:hypothetical protein
VTLRPRTSAALPLAALLALTGCGGGDKSDKQSSKTSQSTASGPQSTSTSPAGKAVVVPAKAIAARKGSISRNPATLEVLELRRGSETTALTLRVSTDGSSEFQIGEAFDDGVEQKVQGASTSDAPVNLTSLDGITLVDTKNRKRYLVGRDSKGVCACDSGLGGVFLGRDNPVILSALYAAPPADVSAVDVLVPRFGTFNDVPVS